MTIPAAPASGLGPRFVAPGQGATHHAPGGDVIVGKLSSAQSGGTFQCVEDEVAPGGGPPPHVHEREDEFFYVLEGEVTFWVCEAGDRTGKSGKPVVAAKGASVFGPRGTAHTFKNRSQSAARMLVVVNPGGNFEAFFAKVSAQDASGQPPSQKTLIERTMQSAPEFGITILGPNPL
ncbi:MAG: cupin domain-containing protein [Planctomycetes bacterium]|nr:cupin domain-containing protein [Planctomycetota bacterium]